MKKFKLSAILASVLSLGMVCNSSAFASSSEEKIQSGSAFDSKVQSRSEEEIETRAKIGKKSLRKKTISKKIKQNEKLKVMLDERLNYFYQLSLYWTPELMKSYNDRGWLTLQRDADSLIEKILKKEDNSPLHIMKILRNFSKFKELKEEYDTMRDIVYIYEAIINNIQVLNYYSEEI